jgi:hypothetical protein
LFNWFSRSQDVANILDGNLPLEHSSNRMDPEDHSLVRHYCQVV